MVKLKILLVIHSLKTGGAENMVRNLARELVLQGHGVRVVSLHSADTQVGHQMRACDIDVVGLEKAKGFDPRTVFRLATIIKDFDPDVIHTHLPVLAYVLPAARFSRSDARIVHTMHNIAESETKMKPLKMVNRYAFHHGVIPVGISEEVRRSTCELYGLSEHAVPIARNGSGSISELGQPRMLSSDDSKVLLCVARFEEQKNHKFLLEVVKSLQESARIKVSLVLVGDGSLLGQCKELARKLGVEDAVSFAGQRSNVPDFYRKADLFVLLSSYEGLPMTIIEAMSFGLPVIATSVGGVPDIVEDGTNGHLVGFDADSAAKVIEETLTNEEEYLQLSRCAVETSKAFTAEKMTEEYLEIYSR